MLGERRIWLNGKTDSKVVSEAEVQILTPKETPGVEVRRVKIS
jgi:hypothetical protein